MQFFESMSSHKVQVAVLMVGINSPPAEVLEGGEMGDIRKLRSRNVRMKYGKHHLFNMLCS